jgi:hypothetical protein
VLYVVVLWMSRGYIPDYLHVGLKWEPQNSCITVRMRSQDGGSGHSKRKKSIHGQSKARHGSWEQSEYPGRSSERYALPISVCNNPDFLVRGEILQEYIQVLKVARY